MPANCVHNNVLCITVESATKSCFIWIYNYYDIFCECGHLCIFMWDEFIICCDAAFVGHLARRRRLFCPLPAPLSALYLPLSASLFSLSLSVFSRLISALFQPFSFSFLPVCIICVLIIILIVPLRLLLLLSLVAFTNFRSTLYPYFCYMLRDKMKNFILSPV